MFSFPREPDQIKAWNRACLREADYQPPRYACICEKHFEPAVLESRTSGRKTLKMDAVPTKYLDGWKPDVDNDLECDRVTPARVPATTESIVEARKVEKVLLKESTNVLPEVEPIRADLFCRLCGIKHEQDNKYDLEELRSDHRNDDIFNVCFLDYEGLEAAKTICPGCYNEVDSVARFVEKCHEGQRRLLEHFSELMQMPIPDQAGVDDQFNRSEDEYLEDGNNDANLSDDDDFETEEMKNARMDRYIDKLMKKYKSVRGKIRGSKSWECLDCREIFQRRTHLAKHRSTCPLVGSEDSKRRGPFRCEVCDKLLSTLPGYRYHLIKKHDNKEEGDNSPEELRLLKSNKLITCPLCSDSFATVAKLRYHLPSHKSTNKGRDSEGNSCSARTSDNGSMCSFCGKMERSAASLEIHMKFHLKQKDWHCDKCDKQYYTKADLKTHVLAVHDKVTYPCKVCGVILKSKITFARHKRIHDVSLQKTCSFCTKRFTTTNALNKHVRSRHQGLDADDMEHSDDEAEEHGGDKTGWDVSGDEGGFQDIIEEVVMTEQSSDFDSKDDIKQEPLLIIEAVE